MPRLRPVPLTRSDQRPPAQHHASQTAAVASVAVGDQLPLVAQLGDKRVSISKLCQQASAGSRNAQDAVGRGAVTHHAQGGTGVGRRAVVFGSSAMEFKAANCAALDVSAPLRAAAVLMPTPPPAETRN